MQNYIILNGVKSTFVKGLLIQSLAPITKPLIRSQVEEIDGRDGDIVTKLGYAAYDKEILIGLHSGFDIDEVIEYFNSEGTVTFSNEPDKYYRYQILAQIDFERLIRFRQATVTFHVQPFKHSTIEKILLENTDNTVTLGTYDKLTGGVRVKVQDGKVVVTGSATASSEHFIPISTLSLFPSDYKVTASASGGDQSLCSLRIIDQRPVNSDSLCRKYMLISDGVMYGHLSSEKNFNYVWLYVHEGYSGTMNLTVSVDDSSIYATNQGNIHAKPTIELNGDGVVELSINDKKKLTVDLSTYHDMVIDADEMDAYWGDKLLNRYVSGDYDELALPVGKNKISFKGTVNRIKVDNYSRWV